MSKEELLNKLVDAFHYEMDWESKKNIDMAMTLCLPIIEEYAQSKVNNGVLDDVSKQSELLKAFIDFYNYRNTGDKTIYNDEIEIFIDSL